MAEYKILEYGFEGKVIAEWNRSWGKEYSVHTLSFQGNLIWGHYFNNLEDAKEYFKPYSKIENPDRIECSWCKGTGIVNNNECPLCKGHGYIC